MGWLGDKLADQSGRGLAPAHHQKPRRSGNTTDVTTLLPVIERLNTRFLIAVSASPIAA
jgi:hypothetical protein